MSLGNVVTILDRIQNKQKQQKCRENLKRQLVIKKERLEKRR